MNEGTTRFLFPIYDGTTHLDFTGPHQFFSRVKNARVTVASLGGCDVAAEGLRFTGLADLRTESCDVLCVPGGAGSSVAMLDEEFMREIRRLASGAKYVTSVCTGSLILAAAGLLRGKRAASHWSTRDLLARFGAIPDAGRVVRDGNVITGGGVTAGIDFALTTIAELFGRAAAEDIQLRLEYAPAPPFDAGRPDTAPADVLERVRTAMAASTLTHRRAVEKAVYASALETA